MQGEVAVSASVRQDHKIGVLAWDWVSARCTTHDARRGVIRKVELLPI